MRIYALIIKEFLAVWQDKKSRFILVVPPIIQLCIFAFAATLDVTNASVGILNQDTGKLSFELVQRFQGAPIFRRVRYYQSPSQLREAIDTQEVMMALHLDAQFSRNLLASKPAALQILLDGRKSNTAQILAGYANTIVDQYNVDLAAEKKQQLPSTIFIQRSWFNENLIYSWFTVPGLVAILTMTTSLMVTALSIARERELGTFDQLLVSPLSPAEILIGKAVPGIIIGILEGSIILTMAIVAFQIPFRGSFLALYTAMFFFVSSVVGIGLFLSSLVKTQQQALLAVFVFLSPAITLSGFATPIENMPQFLQDLTVVDPLRYFLVIVRGVFLKDIDFDIILSNLYPIAITAAVTLTLSAWTFRRRLE